MVEGALVWFPGIDWSAASRQASVLDVQGHGAGFMIRLRAAQRLFRQPAQRTRKGIADA